MLVFKESDRKNRFCQVKRERFDKLINKVQRGCLITALQIKTFIFYVFDHVGIVIVHYWGTTDRNISVIFVK